MFEPVDGKLKMDLAGKAKVSFRLDPNKFAAIEEFDEMYLLKSATYKTLSEAVLAFRHGRADYTDASERIESLYIEVGRSIDGLLALSLDGMVAFLADPAEAEILRGWFKTLKPQQAIDATRAFIGAWKKGAGHAD
jgi:hypothetical protein